MVREINAPDVQQVVDAFEAAGLTEAVAPASAAMRRRVEVEQQFTALFAAGTDVRPLAARIAAGELDLAAAVNEFGPLVAMFDAGSIPMIRHLRDHVRRRCLDDARRFLIENADQLGATVEAAAAKLAARIDKLDDRLDGVGSDEDAARAGGPAAKAWLDRKDLDEQRNRIGDVIPAMQRLGILERVVA